MKSKAAFNLLTLSTLALAFLLSASSALAQTTAFTYQGRMTDSGSPGNGNYDLQFTLWDALTGGTQQPQASPVTVTNSSVPVVNGVFTVQLDFGPNAFTGTSRFLEISGRPSGTQTFATLVPRQQISSTPYAIRTLTAASADGLSTACVACVQDSQINQVAGSKIIGAIPIGGVPGGNQNYIQNSTALQTGDFNITGNGTAGGTLTGNFINAMTHYRIGGSIVLSVSGGSGGSLVPNTNTFTGIGAGIATIPNGFANFNSFFGHSAGESNVSGKGNSYFGYGAGGGSTGNNNIAIGFGATVADGLSNAIVIGAGADVAASNSLVLGSGVNVGIGTDLPQSRLHVVGNSLFATNGTNGLRITPASDSDIGVLNVTNAANTVNWLTVGNNGQVIMNGGRVGIGTFSPDQRLSVNGDASKFGGGSWEVYSDERLKTIKGAFSTGLRAVMQLHPIRYEYKRNLNLNLAGEFVGFSAQAVEKVVPEAVTKNDQGYLLVNNDPIMWTMLNAIKEQQAQIEKQQEQIQRQEERARQQRGALATQAQELKVLKNLVCRSHRRATVCK